MQLGFREQESEEINLGNRRGDWMKQLWNINRKDVPQAAVN